jgi:hypothetical protein
MKLSKYVTPAAITLMIMGTGYSVFAHAEDTAASMDQVLENADDLDQALEQSEIQEVPVDNTALQDLRGKKLLVCRSENLRHEVFRDFGYRARPTERRALEKCTVHSAFACRSLGCRVVKK